MNLDQREVHVHVVDTAGTQTTELSSEALLPIRASLSVRANLTSRAGQQEFFGMRDQQIKMSEGFVLVYSIDDRRGFEDLPVRQPHPIAHQWLVPTCESAGDHAGLMLTLFHRCWWIRSALSKVTKFSRAC